MKGSETAEAPDQHKVKVVIANDATEAKVTFTNTLGDIAPTGVNLRILPFALIVLAGGALLLVMRRRRRTE